MSRRLRVPILIALLTAAFQMAAAGAAFAHHPEIAVTGAICDGTSYQINYTSTSWSLDAGQGENPQIDILFNDSKVGQGAYVFANQNEFSGSAPAPGGPGSTVVVKAVAVGDWGSGVAGGQEASVSFSLPSEPCGELRGTGRFTGGGKQVDVGVAKVTRGLTIHCDLLLSNNLEINWGVREHFHMTRHLTAVCSDDPAIDQRPPNAPLDTLVGMGTGRYNNQDGYTVEFTLVDAGEPGRMDRMAIRIFQTSNPGNVVLNVPLAYLIGGNLQAHYDQPHKNKP